ncbi:ceramide kinase-like protein [Dreissena polymorpha]|uniref:ceramide kinase-like protein n=1 Tax=Dreissena polymorpha TaxID=45954 RepID=UPI002263B34A|nr:ceramide kinase-like protein [Dreissena polymorpha]
MPSNMGDMDEYIFDDDGNPILQCPNFVQQENIFANEPDLKDIFHIKSDGFDVLLSLAKGLITWTNVNPSGKKKKKGKGEDRNTVMLKDIFAVSLKRKKSNTDSDEGFCIGFTLHICDIFGPNLLSERAVVFEHPSEALCNRYLHKIQSYITKLFKRPTSVKLFLQTHAGGKNGSSLYKSKVLPLFQAADVQVDCVEVQHNEHIKQEMVHINLDAFDCIIAMGGDGTANKVADGLMTASQRCRDVDQKLGFTPVRARLPFGIIPCGSTNDICRSITGCEDIVTSIIHILMGQTTPVDVCTAYNEDKFLQWCFNCQYGFGGNVLTFRERYKKLGKRGLEPAFIKALTKAKLRPYECDIEYIAAEQLPSHRKHLPCFTGCDTCWTEKEADGDEVTQDLVQAFDPLDESNNSDTLVNLAEHEDNPWRSRKGKYLNIGLFTIPGRSEIATRGVSKYSHLNDGTMDLVLVKEAPRKEFLRVIKRMGTNKDAFDFPFIEVLRVKEMRFRLRIPLGFQYNDHNFSEIDYEINRQQKMLESATKSTEILDINELSDSDEELEIDDLTTSKPSSGSVKSKSSLRVENNNKPKAMKTLSVQQIDKKKINRTNTETSIDTFSVDDSDDSDGDDSNDEKETEEIVTIDKLGVRTVRSATAPKQTLLGPAYRMTFTEQDRARRMKRSQKKENKKKAKEEKKMKSVWNIDYEICQQDFLHVKVHHGLLRVYGRGISPETIYSDPTLLCIPRI